MPAATFVTDIEISDSDLFSQTAREWQVDFVQLDQGPFSAKIRQIGMKGIQVGEASLSRRLHQVGLAPPGGRTFVIQKVPVDGFVWRNFQPGEDQMLCYPYNADFEVISPAGFDIYVLSVPWQVIEEKSAALEYRVDASLHLGFECVKIPPRAMSHLRQRMEGLLAWMDSIRAGADGTDEEFEQRLDEAVDLVISIWLAGQQESRPSLSLGRGRVLKKAMDHIQVHERHPLTVRELCRITGASERTIQYTFREKFQLTPKQYLLARRLEGVRKELSSCTDRQIKDVANSWGFSHLSQFSAQYRTLFGELPSQSRMRRRKGQPELVRPDRPRSTQ